MFLKVECGMECGKVSFWSAEMYDFAPKCNYFSPTLWGLRIIRHDLKSCDHCGCTGSIPVPGTQSPTLVGLFAFLGCK